MSPTELIISRVISMGGREYTSKEVCYAEYSMSIKSLRSTFKRLVMKEVVKAVREEQVDGRQIFFYKTNQYLLRKFIDSSPKYKKTNGPIFPSYGWEMVWPEFFVDPKYSGKKRVYKQLEA